MTIYSHFLKSKKFLFLITIMLASYTSYAQKDCMAYEGGYSLLLKDYQSTEKHIESTYKSIKENKGCLDSNIPIWQKVTIASDIASDYHYLNKKDSALIYAKMAFDYNPDWYCRFYKGKVKSAEDLQKMFKPVYILDDYYHQSDLGEKLQHCEDYIKPFPKLDISNLTKTQIKDTLRYYINVDNFYDKDGYVIYGLYVCNKALGNDLKAKKFEKLLAKKNPSLLNIETSKEVTLPEDIKRKIIEIKKRDQKYRGLGTIEKEQGALDSINRIEVDHLYRQYGFQYEKLNDTYQWVFHHSSDCEWNKKWMLRFCEGIKQDKLNITMLNHSVDRFYNGKKVCDNKTEVIKEIISNYGQEYIDFLGFD